MPPVNPSFRAFGTCMSTPPLAIGFPVDATSSCRFSSRTVAPAVALRGVVGPVLFGRSEEKAGAPPSSPPPQRTLPGVEADGRLRLAAQPPEHARRGSTDH